MSVWNSSGLDSGEMRAGAQNNTSVVLTSEQQVGENNQQHYHPRHHHDHQYHYQIKRNNHQHLHHIFLMDGHNQDSSESYSYESIVRVSILSLLFTLATSGKLGNQTFMSNDWSKSVPLSDSWTEAMHWATETKMELEFDLILRQLSRPALTPMWRRFWYLQVFDSSAKKWFYRRRDRKKIKWIKKKKDKKWFQC